MEFIYSIISRKLDAHLNTFLRRVISRNYRGGPYRCYVGQRIPN